MTGTGHRHIGLLLLLIGVVMAGLVLFAAPAEAHGAHSIQIEAATDDTDPEHTAHGHLSHCHGGAFCPAAAVVAHAPTVPAPMLPAGRCARPEHAAANAVPTSFDPPPPRFLI